MRLGTGVQGQVRPGGGAAAPQRLPGTLSRRLQCIKTTELMLIPGAL